MKMVKAFLGGFAQVNKTGMQLVRSCLMLLLCAVLVFTFVPVSAMASEAVDDPDISVEVSVESYDAASVIYGETIIYKISCTVTKNGHFEITDELGNQIKDGSIYFIDADTDVALVKPIDGKKAVWKFDNNTSADMTKTVRIRCNVHTGPIESDDVLKNTVTVRDYTAKDKIIEGPILTTMNLVEMNLEEGKPHKTASEKSELQHDNREIDFTIKWINWTADDNAKVVVTDVLHEGFDFIPESLQYEGEYKPIEENEKVYDPETRTLTWTFENVGVAEHGTIKFTCKLNKNAQHYDMIKNQANVAINGEKPKPTEETVTYIEPNPPKKAVINQKEYYEIGDIVEFDITGWVLDNDTCTLTDVLDEEHDALDFIGSTVYCNGRDVEVITIEDKVNGHTRITWDLANSEMNAGDFFTVHLKTRVKSNIPIGVTEIENTANLRYGAVGSKDIDPVTVKVINNALVISKTVTGAKGNLDQEFHFTITVDDTAIDGKYGEVEFNGGTADFYLSDNESIRIKDLPLGTRFTVKEDSEPGFTTTVNGDTRTELTDVIRETGNTVNFVNHYEGKEDPEDKGNLYVTNRITGAGADLSQLFHFKVELDDPTIQGMYGDCYFEDGETAFSLGNGGSKTISGLPVGIGYTVTETDANQYGYTTTSTGAVGTIEADELALAAFVNDKPKQTEPTKEVINVEKGDSVSPGDEIVYRISWTNDLSTAADVVVKDTLDQNVEYVRSSDGGVYDGRTVTWYLNDQPAGQKGYVTLTVRVKESALTPGEVSNSARVRVGNTAYQWTEPVEVPVVEKPHKTLLYPDSGTAVTVGDKIGYGISWYNTKGYGARIVITDELDKGVDFVSADNGGTYNPTTRTVTWVLSNRGANAKGMVTLVVEVNDQAEKQHAVINQAKVRINSGAEQKTEEVVVPVGEKPHKTLLYPVDGKAAMVGDEIGYSISWYNGKEDSARVVITDPLDAGVDFVSADNGGIYDAKTHTVTWTLQNRRPGASGKVSVIVEVNDKALKEQRVTNRAEVRIGSDPSQKTEVVEVQVGDRPHKTLLYPEKDIPVPEGSEIGYSISWYNNCGDDAKVTITDPLDDGVEFVSADNGGTYNPDTHTVTWMLDRQKTGASGSVTLRVKVNEKAVRNGSVDNQATVQVNGETPVPTETVTVLTDIEAPHKTLLSPAEGTAVQVSSEVSYQITWCNVHGTAAMIEDVLDSGVDFVSAVGGTYNPATRAVTWNIGAQTPGTMNTLTLTVRVNAFAATVGEVDNQATVTVGGTVKKTELVTVPVEEVVQPVKEEIEPGEGMAVGIGDTISYNITWKNQSNQDAAVIVRDALEAGVEYVSASSGGVYDPTTRTVTWTITGQRAGAEGSVSLVVRVTASAATEGMVANSATVQVGGNPAQTTNTVENPLKTGSLTVSKSVAGNTGEAGRDWNFIITLDNSMLSGRYGALSFVHGQARFTLKHGEKVQITGLPAGLGYTITEVEANQDQYKTRTRNANGVVEAGEDIAVTFINTRGAEPETNATGSMAVRKLVTGDLGDPERQFHFKVVLSDTSLSGWYGDMEFTDGVAQFTLHSAEHLWARYLPVGTRYTVTETEANQEGYRAIINGDEGIIYGISRLEARFQNHKGDWLPEYDDPWEDLPDPDVPQADIPNYPEQQGLPPATGDQWVIVLWILLMAASALGIAAVYTEKRRHN